MAGIKDIAKKTGLSLATISRVFNNSPLVSDKTKNVVLEAAKALDYQPNLTAAALRSGKSKIIGVIVPEINNPFFSSIINGIEQHIGAKDYRIIIAQSHELCEKELHAIQSFIKLNVDGILLSISKQTKDFGFLDKLSTKQIPLVFFDRNPPIKEFKKVLFDDYQGAFLATKHLIDQGCKQIAHVAGDQNISLFQERKKGYHAALKAHQSPISEPQVIQLHKNMKLDRELLKTVITQYGIDGFFINGDEDCIYVLNIIKTLEFHVPDQVKLIGFGNLSFGALVHPSISTVDQRGQDMGLLAAKAILESLITKNQTEPVKEILSPKLVVRNSSS